MMMDNDTEKEIKTFVERYLKVKFYSIVETGVKREAAQRWLDNVGDPMVERLRMKGHQVDVLDGK
jgi:hypothetical protein